jgi:hypothetical protein
MGLIDGDTTNRKSIYDPHLTIDQIRDLECDCVNDGLNGLREIPSGVCNLRRFFRKFDIDIGVSNGVRTQYVLVKYQHNGDVHGFPVTEQYLIDIGATL